jgi:hypothetical protein
MKTFEDVTPNPEFLIKSIAEQGYSLEAAIADLIDNSISSDAKHIELLTDIIEEPFRFYLADDGIGMTLEELKENMKFPSNSPDNSRQSSDLGRFGLGMKTASFSQTRKFTIISRKKDTEKFNARTWDLEVLKSEKSWKLIVNTENEINKFISDYYKISEEHLESFTDFHVNTIIIWEGLYKFEEYLKIENKKKALKKEISEITSDYLSLVFHKFMEQSEPLKIRINNSILQPFNPFPKKEKDLRVLEFREKNFSDDIIKMEGYVLPSRSIEEARNGTSIWTTKYKSLIDMEGIYIYRANRIILFGGWNGIIKRAPRMQLARLKVDIGNSVDHLLHLNVAKSQVIIPHDLKKAFEDYVDILKYESNKEYYNRTSKSISNKNENKFSLFEKVPSNKGMKVEINKNYPLLQEIEKELSEKSKSNLKVLIKMINIQIDKIKDIHEEKEFLDCDNEIDEEDLLNAIKTFKKIGFTTKIIKNELLPNLGYKLNTIPEHILKEINE